MLIGSLAAIVHGCAWPVLNIVFGELIDSFTDFAKNNTNATTSPTASSNPTQDFDDQMQLYAVIFSLIGVATVCFAYLQVIYANIICSLILLFACLSISFFTPLFIHFYR